MESSRGPQSPQRSLSTGADIGASQPALLVITPVDLSFAYSTESQKWALAYDWGQTLRQARTSLATMVASGIQRPEWTLDSYWAQFFEGLTPAAAGKNQLNEDDQKPGDEQNRE